jgi:hypothetical protein
LFARHPCLLLLLRYFTCFTTCYTYYYILVQQVKGVWPPRGALPAAAAVCVYVLYVCTTRPCYALHTHYYRLVKLEMRPLRCGHRAAPRLLRHHQRERQKGLVVCVLVMRGLLVCVLVMRELVVCVLVRMCGRMTGDVTSALTSLTSLTPGIRHKA